MTIDARDEPAHTEPRTRAGETLEGLLVCGVVLELREARRGIRRGCVNLFVT